MALHLPTLAEESARRAFTPIPKGASRLDVKAERDKAEDSALELFRLAVWTRDKSRCRVCGRKVIKSVALVPNRGDVHHMASRAKAKALLTDTRNGLLVCAKDHARLTGKVNDRIFPVQPAASLFVLDGKSYVNADKDLTFEEMAK